MSQVVGDNQRSSSHKYLFKEKIHIGFTRECSPTIVVADVGDITALTYSEFI